MRRTLILCDHCEEEFSIDAIATGEQVPVRIRERQYDLCARCWTLFERWLKGDYVLHGRTE